MNNNQENTTSSTGSLRLPEPDPDNITVLAHNLPSKPILPWNRFDYPSVNKESNQLEQTSRKKSSATSNDEDDSIILFALSALLVGDISLKELLILMMD